MGGFSGRLGPAIGYMWNGKWCLRSRPVQVRNPRTPEQVAHRTLFREEVRLAARMRLGVAQGFTAMARQMGMTCFNLFVSLNQSAFSLEDERLVVDYRRLRLSSGPVAPVAFRSATIDGNNVVNIEFEKNPLRVVADGYDQVKVYVYCPDLEEDYLSAPVYRRDRRLRFVLPDEFAGHEVHLYGIVQDDEGVCAESAYITIGESVEINETPQSAHDGLTSPLEGEQPDGIKKVPRNSSGHFDACCRDDITSPRPS